MAFRYFVGLILAIAFSSTSWADNSIARHQKAARQPNLPVEKLHPSVRKTPLKAEIKIIPNDAIAQFLSSPRVVDKDELENSPYIVDFVGEHLIVGSGDKIYVRSILEPTSLKYMLYREGQPYISPDTGEVLGYEAIYIATALLEKEGDPATLSIIKSSQEIRLGDRLMPSLDQEAVLNYTPKPPEFDIKGTIISVLNGVSQIGQRNIVVLDKGIRDGLNVGDLLNIYHSGAIIRDPYKLKDKSVAVKLPNEIAGSLMIFRLFDRVSYALVMDASQAIHVLDQVRTP
jgi:hypothetical protein